MTVDLPLKLPISTIALCAGTRGASMPRNHFVLAEKSRRPLRATPRFFDNRFEDYLESQPMHLRSSRYIFSGAAIPSNESALTNCASTNSVSRSKNAFFCSSASDKMWCL